MHLTYRDSKPHTSEVSTAKAEEAGAPEIEIEITPAMMEAGVRAFEDRDNRVDRPRDVVEDIFMSIMEARQEELRHRAL
jgi:hypothetical protein